MKNNTGLTDQEIVDRINSFQDCQVGILAHSLMCFDCKDEDLGNENILVAKIAKPGSIILFCSKCGHTQDKINSCSYVYPVEEILKVKKDPRYTPVKDLNF